jgi:serine/threonine protein kinase
MHTIQYPQGSQASHHMLEDLQPLKCQAPILIKKLGKGNFGTVYEVKLDVASSRCRCVYKTSNSGELRYQQEFLNEAWILHKLQQSPHPNIIKIQGVDIDSQYGLKGMVLEMAECDLINFLTRSYQNKKIVPNIGNAGIVDFANQLSNGLAYLHGQGIIHCDVKPDNILVMRNPDGSYILKYADFGSAAHYPLKSATIRGSFEYMSPEAFAPKKDGFFHLTPESDLYSLGMAIYSLFTMATPWGGYECSEISFLVSRGYRPQLSGSSPYVNSHPLVRGLCSQEPGDRKGFFPFQLNSLGIYPPYSISQPSASTANPVSASAASACAGGPMRSSSPVPPRPLQAPQLAAACKPPVHIIPSPPNVLSRPQGERATPFEGTTIKEMRSYFNAYNNFFDQHMTLKEFKNLIDQMDNLWEALKKLKIRENIPMRALDGVFEEYFASVQETVGEADQKIDEIEFEIWNSLLSPFKVELGINEH